MSSFLDQLLNTVKDAAPTIAGAAATGLAGPGVGMAVSALVRKVAGVGKDTSLEDAAQSIMGDPSKLMQFRVQCRQMELDELKIRTSDVQDARATLEKSKGAVVVSTIVLTSYFVAMIFCMVHEIPQGSQNLAYLLLGNLATGFGMVLTFWLGSSVGSKNKDKILARYADAAKADQAARSAVGGG